MWNYSNRLADKCAFFEMADPFQSLDLLTAACNDLRNVKLFRQLLNIILMMGNYMNGANFAGGAFGFKIASINRVSSLDLQITLECLRL
jgi:hypothetical protein